MKASKQIIRRDTIIEKLLSKTHKRQLQLLKHLHSSDSMVPMDKLAELLACSTRMLKEDLQQIAQQLPQYDIQVHPYGVTMANRFNVEMNLAYQHYLANSLHFQLLEYLFFNPNAVMEEVLEHFFMSYPTFYRTIRRINRWFNSLYNIQISTKPLQLVGNENEIRFFYGQYFAERYPATTWPFEGVEEAHVDQLIDRLIQTLNRPIDYALYSLIKRATIINIIRHPYTSDLSIQPNPLARQLNKNLQTDRQQPFIKALESYMGQMISERLLINMLYPFLRHDFFYSFSDMLIASRLDASVNTSLTQTQLFIQDICQHFQLELDHAEILTILLHNVSSIDCYEVFAKSEIFLRHITWLHHLQDNFPEVYRYIEQRIIQYQKRNKRSTHTEIVHYLVYTLFSSWENLIPQLMARQRKIKVAIFSNLHSSHASLIRDLLASRCSNQLVFEAPHRLNKHISDIEVTDYDVILSNGPIPQIRTQRFININSLSIDSLIDRLNKLANELPQSIK